MNLTGAFSYLETDWQLKDRQQNIIQGSLRIDHSVDYSLLIPTNGGPWPLLTVLHGFGQAANSFIQDFAPLTAGGVMIAAPQAPHHFYTNLNQRKVGFSWLTRYQRDRSIAEFGTYMGQFQRLIAAQYAIDPEQRFVAGFSQGVSMAYRMAIHSDVRLQGLIALGGDLPPDVADRQNELRAIRILLVHGRSDAIVPCAKAVDAFQTLSAHGHRVELFEFDGGHSIPPAALDKIAEFIAARS